MPASFTDRRFGWILLGIVVVGVVLRLTYVASESDRRLTGDGFAHSVLAEQLAEGEGYVQWGSDRPDAHWPPVWRTTLAVPSWFGFTAPYDHQRFASVLGGVTIALIGLAGRRIVGSAVGLTAAGIAAVYPGFWIYEQQILSEVGVLLVVTLVVLLAFRYWDRPTLAQIAVLGATVGVATLVRAELAFLCVALILPLVALAGSASLRTRAFRLAVAAIAVVAVLTPWVVRNNTGDKFEEPVMLTTSLGTTMAGGACDPAFSQPLYGYKDSRSCIYAHTIRLGRGGLDRSQIESEMRSRSFEYIGDHLDQYPLVLLAREGRAFSLYRPTQQLELYADWTNSPIWPMRIWLAMYWLMLPFAAYGIVQLRRLGRPVFPLLAPVFGVVVTIALTWGNIRYRAAAEPALVLLASVALVSLARRYLSRSRSGSADSDLPDEALGDSMTAADPPRQEVSSERETVAALTSREPAT